MAIVKATEEFGVAGMASTQGMMQVRKEIHAEDSVILGSFRWTVSVKNG